MLRVVAECLAGLGTAKASTSLRAAASSIGVRPTDNDLGVGVSDAFAPLSASRRLFPGTQPGRAWPVQLMAVGGNASISAANEKVANDRFASSWNRERQGDGPLS